MSQQIRFAYPLTNSAHTEIFPVLNGLPDLVEITAAAPITLAGDIEFTSDNPAQAGFLMLYLVNVVGGIDLNTHNFKLNDYTFPQEILAAGNFIAIFVADGTDWGTPYIAYVRGGITGADILAGTIPLTALETFPVVVEPGVGTDSIKRTAIASDASGTRSVNLGGDSSSVASGLDSFIGGGGSNEASGYASAAFGVGNKSSGYHTFVAGSANEASGQSATAFGNNTKAIGNYSTALGHFSKAGKYGQVAKSAGANNTSYFSQKSELFARCSTIDATPEILALDGAAARIPIDDNTVVRFKGTVTAVQYAGSTSTVGDIATFDFYGTIKNVAGSTVLVDSILWMDNTGAISVAPAVSSADASATTWAVAIVADNVNNALEIQVTGEIDKLIHWHCVLEFNEIKFDA